MSNEVDLTPDPYQGGISGMERSFVKEVEKLKQKKGEVFKNKTILAITKALLCVYQSIGYARLYLKRLGDIVAFEPDEKNYRFSLSIDRRLAAWMAFEDVIRVAQLKTRAGRIRRIRAELGVTDDGPLKIVDYLNRVGRNFED